MSQSKVIQFLTLLLIVIGISSSNFTVHAATYAPGVSVGQWAKYETLYDRCQSSDPTMCQSQGNGDLNDTAYGLIRIVDVSGTTVTFQLFTQYKNGTTSSQGAQVDVASGYSNVTSLAGGAPSDYFVLASGLQVGDHIWDPNLAPTAPTLNQTTTEQVLGLSRTVNTLNYTTFYSGYGSSFLLSTVFTFDQQSGVFIGISFNSTITSLYGNSQTAFALGMVDNNIWLSSTLPDFMIGPILPITFQAGGSGTTTITLTGQNGFSSTISLSVVTVSDLTCTLDRYTIQGSGTATMTCESQPVPDNPTRGSTVMIHAVSGYSTQSAQTTVTVWDFSIYPISSIAFQTGSSGTATIGFIGQAGFSRSINLSVDAPAGLTCTLDHNTVEIGGSATLTCNGQPGTYTVTINANGGGSTRSAQTTVTVNSAPAPNQPNSGVPLTSVYIAVVVAAIVAIAGVVFFLRRKSSAQTPEPGASMPRTPQTPA